MKHCGWDVGTIPAAAFTALLHRQHGAAWA